ncbi:RnfABCDGE type electron transport complex subunit D [Dasania sp. GY-MA-18]|uniref:Ion-translocating oxidoreductase complex subunit D n=1 Tax=Dasania phycosphaerae TaxID=2950436 RepID=A0A9J6RQB7_9GAMM|nr:MULTISPECIES: RnfABCDGE type electron transport complex subunit D [Dasania]MCR8923926.1 RnfABCDGE type electron transport complex subunit D [Dasania sp. GY-MA-18]MCZ0866360.1 RnfABCDGE type electron transport complex subunit D [Dasania phycosphaerae]MCZ0870084.1 RnfABCDGE type electron transport complex subunit D [Dasania phycosphaerae]
MSLLNVSSPHAHRPLSTATVMQLVLLATLPGIAALSLFFGWGTLLNLAIAIPLALLFEACVLKLRQRPLAFYLGDYSAVVTAVLLAIALPPHSPIWLVAIGIGFAIIIAKHLYGGLGYNPFNPAMVAYVVLLISFPVEMTQWAAPLSLIDSGAIDGHTMATPLDVLKNNNSELVADLFAHNPGFGRWAGLGWEWVNLSFLAGGCFLLYKRVFTWHAPVAMLSSLAFCSLFFYDGGSSASKGSPLFHLLSGATMFGAFFIITDPVTSAVSNRGRLVYGALIGLLLFVIRAWGNYPDALAFAVLLMNFAAPFIDYYTQPRTYGHKAKQPPSKEESH